MHCLGNPTHEGSVKATYPNPIFLLTPFSLLHLPFVLVKPVLAFSFVFDLNEEGNFIFHFFLSMHMSDAFCCKIDF